MKGQAKYFVFNKTSDFAVAHLENAVREEETLRIGDERYAGAFISRILDSREQDMDWHRLTFSRRQEHGAFCKVVIFASNSLELSVGGTRMQVEELISDERMPFSEKLRYMEPFVAKTIEGAEDILLHEVCGRYLWFSIETAGAAAYIDDMIVHFPRRSWLEHLPEVYRANDKGLFLERYLAVFQTLYEDLDAQIRNVPTMIDVDAAAKEVLEQLAGWLDITNSYIWPEDKLRRLLRNAVRLYMRRGTCEGILDLIRLYVGGEAYLAEYHKLEPFLAEGGPEGGFSRLYGNNPYILTVLIDKKYVPTQKEFKALSYVIDEVKPAQMELKLVVLEPYMFLGSHVYLGINSALGEYRSMALDGTAMIPFSTISHGGS